MTEITELMRGIPNATFAAALLRQLADAIEREDARLTAFNNNVWSNKGLISLSWEEVKRD